MPDTHKKSNIKIEIISWAAIFIFFIIVLIISKEKLSDAMKESDYPNTVAARNGQYEEDFDVEDEFIAAPTVSAPTLPATTPAIAQAEVPPLEQVMPSITVDNVSTRDVKLYFMAVNSDGSINRKETIRPLPKTGGPLRVAIEALLEGPTVEERSKGCRTLISEGTKLIGASVRDGIATLNFNENFEMNNLGVQGLIGQLEQIVFTATEFATVNSVQFLVDGQQKEYLGTDGVWIGSPLNRTKF